MPRAFTAVEKQTIREKLMEAGRACFLRFGLKKTTIEDLTGPAGIAKASFYLFFDSKESLFVELFLQEMPAMMERLLDVSFRATDDTREALIRLMSGFPGTQYSIQNPREPVSYYVPGFLTPFITSLSRC